MLGAGIPFIPVYVPKPFLAPETEAEVRPSSRTSSYLKTNGLFYLSQLARLRLSRLQLLTEHAPLARAARRAVHELELAALELRAAEGRRRAADGQLEKARAGVLGIEFEVERAGLGVGV